MSNQRKAFLVDRCFLISHVRWLKSGRKKASWLAKPKKDRRSVMFLDEGKEEIASFVWIRFDAVIGNVKASE